MDRDTFDLLCHQIDVAVGAQAFKSEAFQNDGDMKSDNALASQQHAGGLIHGETKLAVTIAVAWTAFFCLASQKAQSTLFSMKLLAGPLRH